MDLNGWGRAKIKLDTQMTFTAVCGTQRGKDIPLCVCMCVSKSVWEWKRDERVNRRRKHDMWILYALIVWESVCMYGVCISACMFLLKYGRECACMCVCMCIRDWNIFPNTVDPNCSWRAETSGTFLECVSGSKFTFGFWWPTPLLRGFTPQTPFALALLPSLILRWRLMT